jgi:excisionase family DNA binding protein
MPEPHSTLDELPAMLDTHHVAELLGITSRSVARLVRRKIIPAGRIPGTRKYTFKRDEILTLLETPRAELHAVLDRPDGPKTRRVGSTPAVTPDPTEIAIVVQAIPNDAPATRHCIELWTRAAIAAGLHANVVSAPAAHLAPEATATPQPLAIVAIDDLHYQLHASPRRRTPTIDDNGDPHWSLLPTIWADPILE